MLLLFWNSHNLPRDTLVENKSSVPRFYGADLVTKLVSAHVRGSSSVYLYPLYPPLQNRVIFHLADLENTKRLSNTYVDVF